jgi:hypothetical protein
MLGSCSVHSTPKEQIKNIEQPSTAAFHSGKARPALNGRTACLPQKAATERLI